MKKQNTRKIPKAPSRKVREKNSFFQKQNVLIAFLMLITAFVFFNALSNTFTNWDDGEYVTQNPHIRDLSFKGIQNIFSVIVSWHYHPLTLLSLAIDYHIWGLNPTGFIAGNIFLHLLSTIVVFFLFKLFTGRKDMAFIVALIFAIHPMRVESVVWISERKDVLYALFYLLALYNYLKYITLDNKIKYYFFALIFAFVSLMAKASAASLPLILMVFDYYYHRYNYKRVIIEKIPFFTLSLIFGILAIKAQSTAIANTHPFLDKIFLATYALSFYMVKFFVPLFQMPLMHFPEKAGAYLPLKYYLSIVIVPILGILIYKLKTLRKELIFGLSFFVFSLALVLIKFPIGPAYLTERYTYMPYIGLAFLLSLCYKLLIVKYNAHIVKFVFIAWLGFIGVKTIVQNRVWRDSISLWSSVIAQNPQSAIAYNNLGQAYGELGKHYKAIDCYNKSLKIDAADSKTFNNRGVIKERKGDLQGAVADFTTAIMLDTTDEKAYKNRAFAYNDLGLFQNVIDDFTTLIKINPKEVQYYIFRGKAFENNGNYALAIQNYNTALQIDTKNAEAINNRGSAHLFLNNFDGALNDINQAIRWNAQFPDAYFNRGRLYEKQHKLTEAIADYTKAIELYPKHEQAYKNRALVQQLTGNYKAALSDFLKALEINPSNLLIYNDIGALKNSSGDFNGAIEAFAKVIDAYPHLNVPYENRGFSKFKTGDMAGACADWRKAAELGSTQLNDMLNTHCK